MQILIWDNDGTIMGSKDPNDTTGAKVIMPNIQKVMITPDTLNIICSGCATHDSEKQDFDADKIIDKFKSMMSTLPISMALFSPLMQGKACYVVIKNKREEFDILKAHENPTYASLVGKFKKPNTGMFIVIKDLLKEQWGIDMTYHNTTMIGDTWHDQAAAEGVGIAFIDAKHIHDMSPQDTFNSKKEDMIKTSKIPLARKN